MSNNHLKDNIDNLILAGKEIKEFTQSGIKIIIDDIIYDVVNGSEVMNLFLTIEKNGKKSSVKGHNYFYNPPTSVENKQHNYKQALKEILFDLVKSWQL